MIAFLSIIAILIFLGGAYFMGNYFLKSFDADLGQKIFAVLFGILLWFAIGCVIGICFLIVNGIQYM
jgi:hypothetical protein